MSDLAPAGINRRDFLVRASLGLASFTRLAAQDNFGIINQAIPSVLRNSLASGVKGDFKLVERDKFDFSPSLTGQNLIKPNKLGERSLALPLAKLGTEKISRLLPADLLKFLEKETQRLQMADGKGKVDLDVPRLLLVAAQIIGVDPLHVPVIHGSNPIGRFFNVTPNLIRAIEQLQTTGSGEKSTFDVSKVVLPSPNKAHGLEISQSLLVDGKPAGSRIANALMKIRLGKECIFQTGLEELEGNYQNDFGLEVEDKWLLAKILLQASTTMLSCVLTREKQSNEELKKVCFYMGRDLSTAALEVQKAPEQMERHIRSLWAYNSARASAFTSNEGQYGGKEEMELPRAEMQGWVLYPHQVGMLDRIIPSMCLLPCTLEGARNPFYWMQTSLARSGVTLPDSLGLNIIKTPAAPTSQPLPLPGTR